MPAELAIQLEQMVALMFMLAFLFVLKLAMIEIKDKARWVHYLTIKLMEVRK